MTSAKQDLSFKKAIGEELPSSLLGSAIDWISDNLNPDEVFDMGLLRSFVGNTNKPDEVFTDEDLKAWALENGFTKQERVSYLS